MFDANVDKVLGKLSDSDRVLDLGGCSRPFNRADWVVDLRPYASRGGAGSQGPKEERFTEDTWVQADICSPDPLPFEDKFFDFVVCSHVLEDIRDPIGLCKEINRISKAGYLETPSIQGELLMGVESKAYAGCYHHRWLVEMNDHEVTFVHKPHFVHSSWHYHLPKRFGRNMSARDRVTWMFWEEGFSYKEDILEDLDAAHAFVHRSVRDARANPDWMYYLVPVQDALASGDVTSKTLRYRLGTARRTWKHLRSDQQEKG